ncbi:hypothetical protein Tco_1134055 [Tanacetum coccineum]
MAKVIKGEFEKIKDIKVEDVSLTCDTQLEVFNNEVNRLSRMDDDLFTYEVKIANIPCDSKMDDDSEHEADDDMGGDDEVELTDEESDDEDEITEVFRIDTYIFDYKTPLCSTFNEFNYLLKVDPWKRISKKRTKNKAKTTKPSTEWKSVKKTKSKKSKSKSTKKSKVKADAETEEILNGPTLTHLMGQGSPLSVNN